MSKPIVAKDEWMRRWLDIVGALAGLLILWPLLLSIAAAVRLTSSGPVLYRAKRVGRHGRIFLLYKFRTMVTDAAQVGPAITTANDQRITKLGRCLRRYKLDELPQLFNILKGDMAWVGPRPEDPRYVTHLTPEQRQVLAVLPGLTSWASLHYRSEEELLTGPDWEKTYVSVVQPDKIQIELGYLQQRTLWSDLQVILKTAFIIFTKH